MTILHGTSSLMARNSTQRAWWQVPSEDLLFLAHQVSSRNQHNSRSIEKCGIMMILKGVLFLHDFIWRVIILTVSLVLNRLTCVVL